MIEVRLLHQEAAKRTEQAEGRLIEAQKMEVAGKLAGGVAHDFNNIIAVIMGYSGLLMADLAPGRSRLQKYTWRRRSAMRPCAPQV